MRINTHRRLMDVAVSSGGFFLLFFVNNLFCMTTILDWATQNGFSAVVRKDKGRTAYVYQACHDASKRLVALKVVHEKNRRKDSIVREATMLQQLNPLG